MLVRRKYGLLTPTGTAVDPAAVGGKESGYGNEATRGTAYQDQRDKEEGGGPWKRALPVRCMKGVDNK